MAGTRGGFSALLAPGLRTIFFRRLKVTKQVYQRYLNVESSKRAYEEEHKVVGLGQMIQKGEGAMYTFDTPIDDTTIRFTHITYGLGFRVTEEMMEDDLYGVMNRMSDELAKSAAYNLDVQGASVLNNAFDSSYTGYDTKELCATDHGSLGGGADQQNEPTSPADFDLTALQAGIQTFETWKDDREFILDSEPKMLIHAAGDIWAVGEVLQSEKIPDSADNAVNVVRTNYGIEPLHLKFLTDTDSWFLTSMTSDHDMKLIIRKQTQFRNSDDPLTGDAIFTGRQRLSEGFGDWHNVYGSPGA